MKQEEWTKESIKLAFEDYIAENGRLPTAPEVDNSPQLPSSRQIQRKFGGLRVLRAELGYDDTDFGSGKSRSKMAAANNTRSINSERLLEKELIGIFGELFVHSEKFYGTGKYRVDFLTYTRDGNFGVDIFTTETKRDLQKNINIKVDKYLDFPKNVDLYFAVASVNLTDEDVKDAIINMSKLSLIPRLRIVTISELITQVKQYRSLE
jgi:hypothetical protein